MAYFLRRRYRQKPRQWGPISVVRGAMLDWFDQHGMPAPVVYVPCWEGAGNPRTLSGYEGAISSATWGNDGLNCNTGNGIFTTVPASMIMTPAGTLVMSIAGISAPATFASYFSCDGGYGIFAAYSGTTAGGYALKFYINSTYVQSNTLRSAVIDNGSDCCVAVGWASNYKSITINGDLDNESTTSYTMTSVSHAFEFGGRSGASQPLCSIVKGVVSFSQLLSSDQVAEIADNPYGAILPRSFPIYSFPSEAAGGSDALPMAMNVYRQMRN